MPKPKRPAEIRAGAGLRSWKLEDAKARFSEVMVKRVDVALRIQRDNRVVQSKQGPGQFVPWEVAR